MIRLNVDNGKITISGRVNTEQEKKQIESAVQRVTGATNVENKLRVSSTGTGSTTQDNQPESK
jgi:osmotically-inducible protein OsmY